MYLEYNEQEMKEMMKDFYVLTGIRIVLFDQEYRELLSYPQSNCAFCKLMKNGVRTKPLCDESDRTSFLKCQKKKQLIIYHCHAGLIEATAPLLDNHVVIGYMMFGQITDQKNMKYFADSLLKNDQLSETAADTAKIAPMIADIPVKTSEQIQAAAKIMEACTSYLILKNMIRLQGDPLMRTIDAYLTEHLADNLSLKAVISKFGISKTKLYDTCTLFYGCGIAEHIRTLRIDRAKKLLRETKLPVMAVSDEAGFADYNYFCRVFKSKVGVSAKKYRNNRL